LDIESTPDIAPLVFRRSLWRYIEGGGKLKRCIIGNLCSGISWEVNGGGTLHKEAGAIQKTALDWNPQGYRKRGRPKRTWRRTIEDEIRNTGRS
jgi:hypothetical protein